MENKFYIYAHINPLKNEIFYIGKGTRKRIYSKQYRSKFWKDTVKKYGYIVDILEEGLTNEEACLREKFYIAKIGRRDLGKGPLVNMTDGGEGLSGRILSSEHKQKIADANRKRIFSEETRKKLSEAHKGKKISKEHKEKMMLARKAKPISEETRKKLSEAAKSMSKEIRQKITEALKGKKRSEETKLKMSESAKKRKISDNIKDKY